MKNIFKNITATPFLFFGFAVFLVSCTSSKTATVVSKPKFMQYTGTFPRANWIANTNVYEVNIRQYTPEGTFNAFSSHLPRLKNMGVKTLWFMPITPIAQKNKKGSMGSPYAAADYTSINPEFGTLQDFKNLVNKAHEMGFKVIIDWVANHTGWDHVWTRSHPEYYLKDTVTKDFLIASGMDDIIELDFTNPGLRKAMIDAMKYWVTETGIDGFRCDLAFWVESDFWLEARTEIEKTKNLFWLAELDPIDNPEYMQVFDCAYTWNFMHRGKDYKEGKIDFDSLTSLINRYDTLPGNAMKLWFTTNHDENTWNGTEYEKYGALALPFAVFSYTWQGIPLVYSGQEIPNHKRLEFFEKDPINWSQPIQLEGFYRSLNKLKETNKALLSEWPNTKTMWLPLSNGNKQVWAYLQEGGGDRVVVFMNISNEPVEFHTLGSIANGTYFDILNGNAKTELTHNTAIPLAPGQFRVLSSIAIH